MSDAQTAISNAKAKLKAGDAKAARELLLQAGYIEALEPAIHKAYAEIIPVPKGQAENADLIRGLRAKEPAARLEAAKTLNKKFLRREKSLFIEDWVRDPRFSEVLIAALDAETDPKAREELALAVDGLLPRYFPDLRAYPVLAKLVGDKSKNVRRCVAESLASLRHPDRYEVLMPLFQDKVAIVRWEALRSIGHGKLRGILDRAQAARLLEPALANLDFPDRDVRKTAAGALGEIGDKKALPALEAALAAEETDSVKEYQKLAIQKLKKGK